ncbi:MAG: YqeG family HAD IIIA-type phosphatase [Clostridia bacterium]
MIDALRPRLFVPSLLAVDLERLRGRGIEGLILDLDNTVAHWDREDTAPEFVEWIERAKGDAFRMCLVSNNLSTRVSRFSRALGIPAIAKAAKPRRRSFRQAMEIMGTTAEHTAVIGDQLFTDVLGGNRLHLFTVLVSPMSPLEFWTTRLVRRAERLVLPRRHTGRE